MSLYYIAIRVGIERMFVPCSLLPAPCSLFPVPRSAVPFAIAQIILVDC
ncbi:MAG: hypothetical protein F6K55_19865 [Moorea sp. SIO4A3]|nr:hypothetical protein [Moorena sp. SIO4A3]